MLGVDELGLQPQVGIGEAVCQPEEVPRTKKVAVVGMLAAAIGTSSATMFVIGVTAAAYEATVMGCILTMLPVVTAVQKVQFPFFQRPWRTCLGYRTCPRVHPHVQLNVSPTPLLVCGRPIPSILEVGQTSPYYNLGVGSPHYFFL